MRLREWAKKNGLSYKTAWRHFKVGMIPGAHQIATGTIMVDEPATEAKCPHCQKEIKVKVEK